MNETCALRLSDGSIHQCTNISNEPDTFVISDQDIIDHIDDAVSVIHTHPDKSPWLSTADRQFQIQTGLPWELHGNVYRPCPPLLGRKFDHGTVDCFTLMRDFYMLTGFDMPDFDRDDNWWDDGQDLYLDNLTDQGFERVDTPEFGDMILICLASGTPNHAAMYIGDNKILHHLPSRLSKRDNYSGFYVKYTHSIWRYSQWQESACTAIYADLAISSQCM